MRAWRLCRSGCSGTRRALGAAKTCLCWIGCAAGSGPATRKPFCRPLTIATAPAAALQSNRQKLASNSNCEKAGRRTKPHLTPPADHCLSSTGFAPKLCRRPRRPSRPTFLTWSASPATTARPARRLWRSRQFTSSTTATTGSGRPCTSRSGRWKTCWTPRSTPRSRPSISIWLRPAGSALTIAASCRSTAGFSSMPAS